MKAPALGWGTVSLPHTLASMETLEPKSELTSRGRLRGRRTPVPTVLCEFDILTGIERCCLPAWRIQDCQNPRSCLSLPTLEQQAAPVTALPRAGAGLQGRVPSSSICELTRKWTFDISFIGGTASHTPNRFESLSFNTGWTPTGPPCLQGPGNPPFFYKCFNDLNDSISVE